MDSHYPWRTTFSFLWTCWIRPLRPHLWLKPFHGCYGVYGKTATPSCLLQHRNHRRGLSNWLKRKHTYHLWFEVNKKPGEHDGHLLMRRQSDTWSPLINGSIKCNAHTIWRNSSLHSGVAWIARDSNGQVRFHAREAFTCSASRLIAELRCIIWVLLQCQRSSL